MRASLIVVSTVAFFCSTKIIAQVPGSRWRNIPDDTSFSGLSMDTKSVKPGPKATTAVWIRSERITDDTLNDGTKYRKSLTRYAIECTSGKFDTLEAVYYDSDGNAVKSVDLNDFPLRLKSPVPDSVGEVIVESVCRILKKS